MKRLFYSLFAAVLREMFFEYELPQAKDNF